MLPVLPNVCRVVICRYPIADTVPDRARDPQARRTRLDSVTDAIVDLGWTKVSLLLASFAVGVVFGCFCTVACFMR